MGAGLKVRKQFILDPEKIKTVKEIVNAETDTEAINRAMDIVIANSKILTTLKSIKGKGNIQDIYGSKIS
jgi:hypothetical protein